MTVTFCAADEPDDVRAVHVPCRLLAGGHREGTTLPVDRALAADRDVRLPLGIEQAVPEKEVIVRTRERVCAAYSLRGWCSRGSPHPAADRGPRCCRDRSILSDSARGEDATVPPVRAHRIDRPLNGDPVVRHAVSHGAKGPHIERHVPCHPARRRCTSEHKQSPPSTDDLGHATSSFHHEECCRTGAPADALSRNRCADGCVRSIDAGQEVAIGPSSACRDRPRLWPDRERRRQAPARS